MTYDVLSLSSMKKHWLLRNSNIPRRFLGLGKEDIAERIGEFNPKIQRWIDDCLEGDVVKTLGGIGTTGVGLLLDGLPGIGKTTHAVVSAMEFVRQLPEDEDAIRDILKVDERSFGMNMRPVYYLTYPEFLSKKKASFDLDAEEKRDAHLWIEGMHGRSPLDWMNVRILILDDLGKEYGSKYDDSSFDEILRARYDKGLPTIITTNVQSDNWESKYGPAMASFVNEAFRHIRLTNPDLRGAS